MLKFLTRPDFFEINALNYLYTYIKTVDCGKNKFSLLRSPIPVTILAPPKVIWSPILLVGPS